MAAPGLLLAAFAMAARVVVRREVTLAELLSQLSYATAIYGKWHLEDWTSLGTEKAAQKLAATLVEKELFREIKANPGMPIWRRSEEGRSHADHHKARPDCDQGRGRSRIKGYRTWRRGVSFNRQGRLIRGDRPKREQGRAPHPTPRPARLRVAAHRRSHCQRQRTCRSHRQQACPRAPARLGCAGT
jgi:arylsulfatase A-like enzyme